MKIISLTLNDLKKYYKYSIYAAKSQLKSEVASSFLNWFWWILDPFLFMMVYSFISIIVFGKSEKYFSAFVFIGLSTWNFFNKTILNSVKIVKNNSSVVSKVYLPKYILILILLMVNSFKMIISFALVAGMMCIYRVPFDWNMLYFIPIIVTLVMVTFGFSTLVLHFGVFIEDLHNIISVLFKLIFYLSGIFYSISKSVPSPYSEFLLQANPAAYIINELRQVLLYGETLNIGFMLFWLLIGCVLSGLGIKVIYKYENSYIKVI